MESILCTVTAPVGMDHILLCPGKAPLRGEKESDHLLSLVEHLENTSEHVANLRQSPGIIPSQPAFLPTSPTTPFLLK